MKNTKRTLALVLTLVMMLTVTSIPAFASTPTVGSTMKFGAYDWRVLDLQYQEFDEVGADGKTVKVSRPVRALLLSDKVLEFRVFHSTDEIVTWETSDMRKYLNGEFYNKFSAEDRARIAETKVVTPNNPNHDTPGGNDTTDRVFLLSVSEAEKYLQDKSVREPAAVDGTAVFSWWLRTPSFESNWFNIISKASTFPFDPDNGEHIEYGYGYQGDMGYGGGVRPAMWITIDGGGTTTPTPPAANPLDSASGWAKEGITAAIGKGFVPTDIQSGYTNVITRAEFCRMAVMWLEYRLGKEIDAIVAEKGDPAKMGHTFSDTTDPNILAAYRLGVTGGTVAPTDGSPGTFNPSGQFSREQAATMIRNTARAAGMDINNVSDAGFNDINAASSWAIDSINYVRNAGIMSGVGTADNPLFNPKGNYTREQSIITFNNIQ